MGWSAPLDNTPDYCQLGEYRRKDEEEGEESETFFVGLLREIILYTNEHNFQVFS